MHIIKSKGQNNINKFISEQGTNNIWVAVMWCKYISLFNTHHCFTVLARWFWYAASCDGPNHQELKQKLHSNHCKNKYNTMQMPPLSSEWLCLEGNIQILFFAAAKTSKPRLTVIFLLRRDWKHWSLSLSSAFWFSSLRPLGWISGYSVMGVSW